uniref:type I protein arginine methyltransferase n=1 Tax=Timema monikensis TaxID=170555 RepID=A0A7R9E6N3_9NEOP|nr:unnamed protein product [Timema monikensis]
MTEGGGGDEQAEWERRSRLVSRQDVIRCSKRSPTLCPSPFADPSNAATDNVSAPVVTGVNVRGSRTRVGARYDKNPISNPAHDVSLSPIQLCSRPEPRANAREPLTRIDFYGYLSQQQNMLQDYVRTSTYQKAILSNLTDFTDKVVLDVGAGSGILSFFAVQAGAKKVYAVEASTMAQHAEFLVRENNLSDKIIVIAGKIEEITLPEQVDVIISEPMGYMLYNERMLESYLHSKKWLKPNGRMFPSQGDLHIAPFTDDTLYMEQSSKANFW